MNALSVAGKYDALLSAFAIPLKVMVSRALGLLPRAAIVFISILSFLCPALLLLAHRLWYRILGLPAPDQDGRIAALLLLLEVTPFNIPDALSTPPWAEPIDRIIAQQRWYGAPCSCRLPSTTRECRQLAGLYGILPGLEKIHGDNQG